MSISKGKIFSSKQTIKLDVPIAYGRKACGKASVGVWDLPVRTVEITDFTVLVAPSAQDKGGKISEHFKKKIKVVNLIFVKKYGIILKKDKIISNSRGF